MSKFLIVPGLPKSGTTFLYAQLSKQLDNFNIPSLRKEIDYFRRGESLSEYRKQFETNDENKVYLDCSPLYADDIKTNTLKVKNCLAGHEVKIMFCMRNPFERMYSHYLHDIAQNFQIMAQAAHSIYMPSVMSRYLYPLAERIKYYKEQFGEENVCGFSFASNDDKAEDFVRDFAELPEEWGFDYSKNPAQGFTSPTTYFSDQTDLTIATSGSLYVLPKNDMLVANRQFSSLHRNISSQIGNNIMKNTAFIDREFDGTLLKESSNLIWDDYERTLDLLGMDVDIDRSEVTFSSQISNTIPDKFLANLDCVGSIDTVVGDIFSNKMRSSTEAIINSIEPTVSLSSSMAKLDRSSRLVDPDGNTPEHYLEYIVEQYGPSPYFLELLFKNWLKSGKASSVIDFMERHPKSSGLFRPVQLKSYLDNYRKTVSDDECERLVSLCG